MKNIFRILIVLCMMLSLMPVKVSAETVSEENGAWAYVKWANGTKTEYGTFTEAWNAATSSGDNNTVGLNNNWDGGHFLVPEGKTLTLELNGWVLTRDLADEKTAGEVIQVDTKAKLTVYGGNKADLYYGSDNSHSVYVYVANADRYGYTRRKETLYGGIINGGNSSDGGGGIHMEENTKVYLYNVTIAGNRAGAKTVEFGDGGGIEMDESYGYLYMQDSQVIYNCARYDGGGVHVDQSYNKIEMVRSCIDHNVADDNGGGIYVDGNNFTLKGDAKQIMDPETAVKTYGVNDWNGRYNYFPPVKEIGSSISYNCVFDAEEGGGGIFCDNQTELIEGVNIFGNIATNTDDDTYGGGIYLDEEEMTVRNCNIFRNKCDQLGGGIYNRGDNNIVDLDDNTVDSCSIYMNLGMASNGAGGGIYVYRYCDLIVNGPTIVRGNGSKNYGDDNVYLSSDGAAVDAYLIPSTAPGADVHVRINSGHGKQISRDAGSYDIQHFSYDNDSNKHIGWDRDWDDRVLKVVDGKKPAPAAAIVFTPESGKRYKQVAGNYNGYPLIQGVVSYPSFPDADADIENIFYYSDGFFTGDTNTYNPQLATLSMCLAGAAGYSNEYGKDDAAESYLDKSQNFRQFVSDIGCLDKDIHVNDFNLQKPGADTIGVGIASKEMNFAGGVAKTLVIIGVRGMGYEKEWISNMTLGTEKDGEAVGWSSAASQIMVELKDYLAKRNIDGSDGNTIFWIAGYSRAGATANLTAKRIIDTYDNHGTHTFAYPIEAPKGGVASAKVDGNNYNCIHNVVNNNDIVPWVGTTEMGLIRYGVDHYVPGSTEISAVPEDRSDANNIPVKNNIPEDNVPWDVENTIHKGYSAQKALMLKQLTAVNQDILFDDYYHQATVRYITGAVLHSTDMIVPMDSHENEIGTTEHFIKFFFERLQEYAFKYQLDGKPVDDYYKNAPRRYFAEYNVANGRTFQQAAASMAALIFGKSSEDTDGLIDCFAALPARMPAIPDMLSLYGNIDKDDIDDLEDEIDNLWKWLTEISDSHVAKGYRSIEDFLTKDEFRELKACFKSLLFPILCFAGEDYDQWGQDILGSMGYNISRIIANHYPEVTHAWLRSYDYLYENDTVPVVMNPEVKTGPSAVNLVVSHADGSEDKGVTLDTAKTGENAISIQKDDVVKLVPSNSADINAGESIYYQFTQGPIFWNRNAHAYSVPFVIADMIDTQSVNGLLSFKVTAAHNGSKLDWVPVQLVIDGSAFISIPVNYANGEFMYAPVTLEKGKELQFDPMYYDQDGQRVDLEDQGYVFKGWEVYNYTVGSSDDEDDGIVGDKISPEKYAEYFGESFNASEKSVTVTNMKGISARFVPVYERVINASVVFGGETGYGGLPAYAKWAEGSGNYSEPHSILWWFSQSRGFVATVSFVVGDEVARFNPSVDFEAENNYYINKNSTEPSVMMKKVLGKNVVTIVVDFPRMYEDITSDLIQGEGFISVDSHDKNEETEIQNYRLALKNDNEVFGKVIAPIEEDMQFVCWQGDEANPSLEPSDPSARNTAFYKPVVNKAEVTLDKQLKAGEKLPEMENTIVTVTNRWVIENACFEWNSTDSIADYEKVYTAKLTVDLEKLRGYNLDETYSGSTPLTGLFEFADDLQITLKDSDGNEIKAAVSMNYTEGKEVVLYLTFPETEKHSIVRFADVSIVVPHGSDSEYILSQLPSEVNAYIDDGRMVSVPVEWSNVETPDSSILDTQTVIASGSYTGSDYLLAEGVSPSASVTVQEVDKTVSPFATPGTGAYTGAQSVVLTADEDATIKYAVKTYAKGDYYLEGTDPETQEPTTWINPNLEEPAPADYQQYQEPITLGEYDVVTVLYTFAEKEGLRESNVAKYRYELTRPEAKKLEAKDATIAEDGNIECWYTFKQEVTGRDEQGKDIYTEVPDQYYRDEYCTELLDYNKDVVIPSFVRSSHKASADDAVALCLKEYEEETITFYGLDPLGVQAIGTDENTARVLTVLDSRIINAATDYGYLFDTDKTKLTHGNAQYEYTCKGTSNNLYSDDSYSYVTAKIKNDFLNPDMKVSFYVLLENGTDYIYTDAIACEAMISRSEATDYAEDNIEVGESLPKFVSRQLILGSQIGMHFYMTIPEEMTNGTMEFTVGDRTVTASGVLQTDGRYKFTCYVNSVEMAESITAKYTYQYNGETLSVSNTYSVEKYLDVMIRNENNVPEYTAATPLAKAIYNYGYYAMQAVPGGSKHPMMPDTYANDTTLITTLDGYAISAILDKDVITKASYSLDLDSETAINFYLTTGTELTKDDVNVTAAEGTTFEYTVEKVGTRYRVRITGIGAHELGTAFTMTTGNTTITASALTYVQQTLANSDAKQETKNAAAALYEYYHQTIEYRK